MKRLVAVLLMAGSSMALADNAKAADTAPIEKTILQMERDWTAAGLKKDFATLDRIIADDWVAIDFQGKAITKAQSIADLKSGSSTNQSVQLGDMKVRVFGNTAVVTGSDTEKSTYKGKDSSGKYVWTDVFVNRNGRWQAVASQSTKVD
jgi:ketosteroid isomerase-like protein